jgi:hypothetical protein
LRDRGHILFDADQTVGASNACLIGVKERLPSPIYFTPEPGA